MRTWETDQIAKLNTLADDALRARFDDLGGVFWVTVITGTEERVSKRYKLAKTAFKAYMKESARYAVIPSLIPKSSGRIALYVGRDLFLDSTWREHAKMWV